MRNGVISGGRNGVIGWIFWRNGVISYPYTPLWVCLCVSHVRKLSVIPTCCGAKKNLTDVRADFLYIISVISNTMRVTQNNSKIYDEGSPIIYGVTEQVRMRYGNHQYFNFPLFFCDTTVCFHRPKN